MSSCNVDNVWKFIEFGTEIPKGILIPKLDTPCWNWIGHGNQGGYGRLRFNTEMLLSHRFLYELFIGKIPNGKQLNHICRNRRCCNPEHLEPVTNQENVGRGLTPILKGWNAKKTHCANGHPYSKDNTILKSNNKRVCRICRSANDRRYYRKKLELYS